MNRAHYFLLLFTLLILSCQSQSKTKEQCEFATNLNLDNYECGYLEVPHSWQTPENGNTKIAYLVIKSTSKNPKPDPVIFLQGGPGGKVLSLANVYQGLALDPDRDFILYDQRGIGYSEAICPNLSAIFLDVMALDITSDQEDEEIKKRIGDCTESLSSDQFKTAYSSLESVKDLEALRKHLGYKQFNIFGGSYGTRLGLMYMELFPKSVRTATLSSLFPPEIRMYDNLVSNFERALQKVFIACENDSECNSKYPELKADFQNICTDLDDDPKALTIDGKQYVINTQDMLLLLHQLMYSRQTIALVPSFITAFKTNNTGTIENAVRNLIIRANVINIATYWSVTNSDEGSFDNKFKFQSDMNRFPELGSGISLFSSDPEILEDWPIKGNNKTKIDTIKSDIPTLLISGNWDPITPPENANITAKSLSNVNNIVFEANGHVVINPCFFQMAKAFLNNPFEKVDDSCANNTRPIRFR